MHPGAGWSSPVARQAHNLKVTGSNPVPATNSKARLSQDSGLSCVRGIRAQALEIATRVETVAVCRARSSAELAPNSTLTVSVR